jgi:succinyl-diaminopimelate desuccinylase
VAGLQRAIERATGAQAKLDTGGGTSDARFITRYCPVAELGAVGATMHKVDECAPIDELRDLATLYRMALEELVG